MNEEQKAEFEIDEALPQPNQDAVVYKEVMDEDEEDTKENNG